MSWEWRQHVYSSGIFARGLCTAAAHDHFHAAQSNRGIELSQPLTLPQRGLTPDHISVLTGNSLSDVVSAAREVDPSMQTGETTILSPAMIDLVLESLKYPVKPRHQQLPLRDLLQGDRNKTEISEAKSITRSPVVAVMGHVDVGKTTLLDALRNSDIAKQEKGGITQRIGAFTVTLSPSVSSRSDVRALTILDTPGHEAFASMRAHGADATDIIVLVVAADDGVMPQTIEAINIARSAGVPIVVAINKCDKEGADPDRARSQLLEMAGINTDELGGDVLSVEISALENYNIDDLLEAVLLQAEMLDLQSTVNTPGNGVCIESRVDRAFGSVATIVLKSGTIRVGDFFVFTSLEASDAKSYGKAKRMFDMDGNLVSKAGPGDAVLVSGFRSNIVPGSELHVVKDEREAKILSEEIARRNREAHLLMELIAAKARQLSDANTSDKERHAEHVNLNVETKPSRDDDSSGGSSDHARQNPDNQTVPTTNVIVKADLQGSLDAVVQCVERLDSVDSPLRVVRGSLGDVTENDVLFVSAARDEKHVGHQSVIVAFNVVVKKKATMFAKQSDTRIFSHSIIYKLEDDLVELKKSLLASTGQKFKTLGAAGVLKVFDDGAIAGCLVQNGSIEVGRLSRVLRFPKGGRRTSREVVFEGTISSIRHFASNVESAAAGTECGVTFRDWDKFEPGDVIECIEYVKARKESHR